MGSDSSSSVAMRADTLAALEKALHADHGGLHFVSGPSQSGRSTLLRDLFERLQSLPATQIIGISCEPAGVEHWSVSRGVLREIPYSEIAKVIAPLMAVVGSPAVGTGIAAGLAIRELLRSLFGWDQVSHPSNSSVGALTRGSKHRRLVLLVDDFDLSTKSGELRLLLLDAAREQFSSSSVHLVFTIEGSPILGAPSPEETDARQVAALLRDRGLATFHGVPAPDETLLRDLFGVAAPDVYEELLTLTESRLGSIVDLWPQWVHSGIVERDSLGGVWHFTGGKPGDLSELTIRLVDEHVAATADDPLSLDRNRRILATAAMEGKRFTAEVVSFVNQIHPDLLMALLDDKSATGMGRLVRFLDWPEVGPLGERKLVCRYEFISDLTWLCCRRSYLTAPEERSVASALTTGLLQLHEGNFRPIFRTLADLLTVRGEMGAAMAYRREADFVVDEGAFERIITMSIKRSNGLRRSEEPEEDDSNEATRLVDFLMWQLNSRHHLCHAQLQRDITDTVESLSRRFDFREALYWSIYYGVRNRLPFEAEGAAELLSEGLAITKAIPYWYRRMRLLQAELRTTLGLFYTAPSDPQEPRSLRNATPAIDLAQQIAAEAHADRDWMAELSALSFLARMIQDGKGEQNVAQVNRLIALAEGLGSTRGLIQGLISLAHIEAIRGGHTEAIALVERALKLAREQRHDDEVALCLRLLVDVHCSAGNTDEARSSLRLALSAFERVGPAGEQIETAGLLDRSLGRDPSSGAVGSSLDQLGVEGEARALIEQLCRKMEWENLQFAPFKDVYSTTRCAHVFGRILKGGTLASDGGHGALSTDSPDDVTSEAEGPGGAGS